MSEPFLTPGFDDPPYPQMYEYPAHMSLRKKQRLDKVLRFVDFERFRPWHGSIFTMLGAQISSILLLAFIYNLPMGLTLGFVLHLVRADWQEKGGAFAFWDWLPYFLAALGYTIAGVLLVRYLLRTYEKWISANTKRIGFFLPMGLIALIILMLPIKPPVSPLIGFLFVCPVATLFSIGWLGPCLFLGWWMDRGLFQRFISADVNVLETPIKIGLVRFAIAAACIVSAVPLLRTKVTDTYPHVLNGICYSLGVALIGVAALQARHAFAEYFTQIRPFGKLRLFDVPSAADGRMTIRITHWSDLHLTGTEDRPRISKAGMGGNSVLARTVHEHESQLRRTDLLLLTGDMTDAGSGEEWRAFEHLMPSWLLRKTVILPGNHDVNITSAEHIHHVETGELIGRKIRLIRSMAALDTVQGERSYICSKEGRLFNLREYLSRWGGPLQRFTTNPLGLVGPRPKYPGLRAFFQLSDLERIAEVDVEGVWRYMFPMVLEIPNTEIKLLLLDTNELGYSIADNAFGRISEDALLRFEKLLAHFSTQPIIIGLHHHLALPKFSLKPLTGFQIRMMMLQNAPSFLRLLAHNRNFVVFHGHLHIGYRLVIDDHIQIVSAPSTTLGDERLGTGPSFAEYEISVSSEGAQIGACRSLC